MKNVYFFQLLPLPFYQLFSHFSYGNTYLFTFSLFPSIPLHSIFIRVTCLQPTLQYVRTNENSVIDNAHNVNEHPDIFLPVEATNMINSQSSVAANNGISLKRRPVEW